MDKAILKGLCDKLYEKRKNAALELEKAIKKSIDEHNTEKIEIVINELSDPDYPLSVEKSVARIARLMGLAAVSIALGPINLPSYLSHIIPSVLICFADQNDQVRFYACESLYNISKIAKGEILVYFNEIFDILCKITSDQVSSVKGAASLLDKLIKDIVSEFASSYVSVVNNDPKDLPPATKINSLTGDVLQERYEQDPKNNLAFSLPHFIPLLEERIYANNPNTRMFLVSWLQVISDSPDLELISYLPSYLGGLFTFLGDSHRDIRVVTANLLNQILQEIKRVCEIKALLKANLKQQPQKQPTNRLPSDDIANKKIIEGPLISERKKTLMNAFEQLSMGDLDGTKSNATIGTTNNGTAVTGANTIGATTATNTTNNSSNGNNSNTISSSGINKSESVNTTTTSAALSQNNEKHDDGIEQQQVQTSDLNSATLSIGNIRNGEEYVPGQDIHLDFPKIITVLINSLNSSEPDVQIVVLKWLEIILELSPRDFLQCLSRLLALLLKHLSDSNKNISESAARVNYKLMDLTSKFDYKSSKNYSSMVNNLSLNFREGNATTKVACLDWLIFIYRKMSDDQLLDHNDSIFYTLLKSLSDEDNRVVSKSLELLSIMCSNGNNEQYFQNFLVKVLDLLKNEFGMLKTRTNFILRQLCAKLSAEPVYKITSQLLDKRSKDDLPFVRMMIQIMSTDLIVAPELGPLRKKLKRNEDWSFFSIIFKCWCHNPSSLLNLCLISGNYELAYNVLQQFVENDLISVNNLLQLDILVQFLESPVFASLRLHLLEYEQYPYLYKSLYAILMILPQSKAFHTLNTRLNSITKLISITESSSLSLNKRNLSQSHFPRHESSASSTQSLSACSSKSLIQNSFQLFDLLDYFKTVCAEDSQTLENGTCNNGSDSKNNNEYNRMDSIHTVCEPDTQTTDEIATPKLSKSTFETTNPADILNQHLTNLAPTTAVEDDSVSVIYRPPPSSKQDL
ncbi:related to Vacuole morphology and inheritance protein 14 [Saccharomycodes ludwigii]|uniref:Related to Vacuole morphology and inheritance protein 14 n=1 Tax=Saccharomycodes ludwigii TaxID=36035 RepID=A0A376B164_9ASCO|nr:related to Vacuole morphology and inheritance protein 14 [Saccharomycodes ludwigii]